MSNEPGPPTGDELELGAAVMALNAAIAQFCARNRRTSGEYRREWRAVQARIRALVEVENVEVAHVIRNAAGEIMGTEKRREQRLTFHDPMLNTPAERRKMGLK